MNVLGYTEGGSIRVEIDGVEMLVPDNIHNRHRQMIAEWEAEGNEIAPYIAPAPPAPRSTAMWRARAVAKATPYGNVTLFDAVEAAIDGMTDPTTKAAAQEAWQRGTVFDLDGQIVPALMAGLSLTEQDVLPLIAQAEALPA